MPRQYNIAMTDDLLRYRSEFPILEQTTYLISNSLGAMPRGVYDAMKGYAETWATRGMAPRELLIRYVVCSRIGNSER